MFTKYDKTTITFYRKHLFLPQKVGDISGAVMRAPPGSTPLLLIATYRNISLRSMLHLPKYIPIMPAAKMKQPEKRKFSEWRF